MNSQELYKEAYKAFNEEKDFQKAKEIINRIVSEFPSTSEAAFAKQLLPKIGEEEKFGPPKINKNIILTTTQVIPNYEVVEILEIILRIDYIIIAISAVWSSLKIVDYVSFKFEKKAKTSVNKFDNVLVPMLRKTAKVLVVSFGGLLVAHSLTFDVASILAGLGIPSLNTSPSSTSWPDLTNTFKSGCT